MKKIIIVVILFTGLFIFLDFGFTEDISYLGEFCWSLHKTEDEHGLADETYLIKIAVTQTGGANYILQGIVEPSDSNPFIFSGAAKIIGNEILMTLNGSQDQSPGASRDTGTLQMRLSTNNFNGTFWSNGFDYDTSTKEFDFNFASGEAKLSNCQ